MIRGVPVVRVVVVVAIVVGRRYSEWSCPMPRREMAVATGIPFRRPYRRSSPRILYDAAQPQLDLHPPCPTINQSTTACSAALLTTQSTPYSSRRSSRASRGTRDTREQGVTSRAIPMLTLLLCHSPLAGPTRTPTRHTQSPSSLAQVPPSTS